MIAGCALLKELNTPTLSREAIRTTVTFDLNELKLIRTCSGIIRWRQPLIKVRREVII